MRSKIEYVIYCVEDCPTGVLSRIKMKGIDFSLLGIQNAVIHHKTLSQQRQAEIKIYKQIFHRKTGMHFIPVNYLQIL